MVLAVASIAVTVAGIVAALCAHAQLDTQEGPAASSTFDQLRTDRLNSVLLMITSMLVVLAVVNAIFIAWATVLDTRHASALARALGVTPRDVSAGLAAAQALPALAGAVLGIPAGLALFSMVSPDDAPNPPLGVLIALVPATTVGIALLTSIPARLAARQRIAETLAAEPTRDSGGTGADGRGGPPARHHGRERRSPSRSDRDRGAALTLAARASRSLPRALHIDGSAPTASDG